MSLPNKPNRTQVLIVLNKKTQYVASVTKKANVSNSYTTMITALQYRPIIAKMEE